MHCIFILNIVSFWYATKVWPGGFLWADWSFCHLIIIIRILMAAVLVLLSFEGEQKRLLETCYLSFSFFSNFLSSLPQMCNPVPCICSELLKILRISNTEGRRHRASAPVALSFAALRIKRRKKIKGTGHSPECLRQSHSIRKSRLPFAQILILPLESAIST